MNASRSRLCRSALRPGLRIGVRDLLSNGGGPQVLIVDQKNQTPCSAFSRVGLILARAFFFFVLQNASTLHTPRIHEAGACLLGDLLPPDKELALSGERA